MSKLYTLFRRYWERVHSRGPFCQPTTVSYSSFPAAGGPSASASASAASAGASAPPSQPPSDPAPPPYLHHQHQHHYSPPNNSTSTFGSVCLQLTMRLRLPRASWVRIAQRGVVLLVLALLWLSLSSVLVQDPDPRQLSRGGGQLLLQRQGQDELVGIDGEDDDNDNDDVRVQPVQADRFARPTRKGVAVLVDEEMTNVDVSAETDKLRKDRFKAVTTSNADNLFGRGHIPVRMAPELVSAVLPSMEAPEMVEELQRFDVRGGDGGDEDDDDEDGNSNKKVVLSPRSVDVVSPDGANRLVAYLAPYGTYNNCLFFTVNRSAVAVLHRSVVMVNFKQYPQSGRALCNLRIVAWSAAKRDTTWKPMYGERSLVRDNGVEKVVYFASTKDVDDDDAADPVVVAKFVMRAYDEGVAWNVKLPDVHVFNPAPGEPYTQIQILSRVVFGGPGRAFVDLGNEFGFETRALDEKGRQWREDVMAVVPLHVQLASSGVHVALSEARNYDFRGMHMHMANQTLAELYLSFTVTSSDVREPLYSPWFVAMLGLGAKELIKHRYLIENLNDPSLIDEDATWVQPGKVYRDVTLSTVGSKQGMSLAHSFDMSYVLLDAGWYGSEYNITSDALHPLELPKKMELNFRKLLQHSAESRVGLFLYINDIALSRQANEAFRLYHIWGIKGVKFGFVNLKASSAKRRILEYVLTCAKYKLLVNIHDNYRPSGISRTLPNLVTQEGIRGDEHQTKADHVLYLPFTRYLIGPADHTYTLEENRLRTMNKSLIMQLAMPIALYSPMQHLFWYLDPWGIQKLWNITDPMFKIWKRMPSTYETSVVINAEPVVLFTVARQSSSGEWFVGTINTTPVTFHLDLSFLTPKLEYRADVYAEDPSRPYGSILFTQQPKVNMRSTMIVKCSANSGHVVIFTPNT